MNKKLFGIILGCTIALTPVLALNTTYAAGLVPDCGKLTPVLDSSGHDTGTKAIQNPCNFDSLMTLINTIINFLLFVIATPLVALILIVAGFKLLTSGGNSEALSKAKKMLLNAIFGYIIALAAWLIIHTILSTLGYTGTSYLIPS